MNKINETEIKKENEFFVNKFLSKMYGDPSYVGDGALKIVYPSLEIVNVNTIFNENSRRKIIFSLSADNRVKEELNTLATRSELSKYSTLPKIEKMVRLIKGTKQSWRH
ncbi:MAG: hypothetical protein NUV46_03525 [Nanoarchaeota archaeon]|nr:hypothetical protein [Nanoarchaeota archaeon]